jgi:hypothetical protein
MEPVHTLQRSDQKSMDKVKRVRNALAAVESPSTEVERDVIMECARELEVNEEAKLQEVLIFISMEGGNDPKATIRAISTCILQLKGEVDQHRKAKEAEAEFKETEVCQLEYLEASTESLEDALKRRSTI